MLWNEALLTVRHKGGLACKATTVEDTMYNLSDLKPGHLKCRTPLLKSEASHSTLTGRASKRTRGNRHIQYNSTALL